MNKTQLAASKKVIENDATGMETLIEDTIDGGLTFCALGGLAKAAGMTNKAIRLAQNEHEDSEFGSEPYPTVAAAISRKFGIAAKWVPKIYETNDRHYTIATRRNALKKLMDRIYAADHKARA